MKIRTWPSTSPLSRTLKLVDQDGSVVGKVWPFVDAWHGVITNGADGAWLPPRDQPRVSARDLTDVLRQLADAVESW